MIEVKKNLFEVPANWLCITTNGIVKDGGFAVMGKGCALEAAQKFWDLPGILGERIKEDGNNVHFLKNFGSEDYVPQNPLYYDKFVIVSIYSFPTKHHYKDKADLELIERSCQQLKTKWNLACLKRGEGYAWDVIPCIPKVVLPRPGVGLGGLDWESEVRPICEKYFLTDDFIVVHK
jgi:hypothetical protein